MDKRIEEIARECAMALVDVRDYGPGYPGSQYHVFIVGDNDLGGGWTTAETSEAAAGRVRALLASAAAAALRRLRDEMQRLPVPSPVSDARLADIAERDATGMPAGVSIETRFVTCSRDRHDLLAHALHLERLVRLLAQESEGLAFAAGLVEGRRLGAKAQREADAEAARRSNGGAGLTYSAACAIRAVESAPLVTDAEGAK